MTILLRQYLTKTEVQQVAMMKTFNLLMMMMRVISNEDIPMVTDANSSSQEMSLVAHVLVSNQKETEKTIIDKQWELLS